MTSTYTCALFPIILLPFRIVLTYNNHETSQRKKKIRKKERKGKFEDHKKRLAGLENAYKDKKFICGVFVICEYVTC